jgi:uncharacterized membrane protein YgaE (UPF0421/DUF939 family)
MTGATTFSALSNAQLAIRAAVASAIAAAIAAALKFDYPIYAFLAAIIATDLTPLQSRQLGLRRLIATLIGAMGGVLVSITLAPSAWSVGLAILVTMFVSQLAKVRSGAKVAGYVAAIIILHFGSDPWGHAFDRLAETVLGITVAWIISFVPMLFPNDQVEARKSEEKLRAPRWFNLDPPSASAATPSTLLTDSQLTIRTTIAATLAILIAQALKLDYPIFAAIAAIVTTDLAPATSRAAGSRRIVATVVGAAFGAAASFVVNPDPIWLGVVLFITVLASESLKSPEGSKIAGCTCGIGMLLHAGNPVHFAIHRVLETSLGVVTAWAVSYLPKLIKDAPQPDQTQDV